MLSPAPGGVRVEIRLTPRGRANRIDGVADGALKVSVTAPPADNEANEALLRLLAREWQVPRRNLSIAAGGKSRNKSIFVAGEPAALLKLISISRSGGDPGGNALDDRSLDAEIAVRR